MQSKKGSVNNLTPVIDSSEEESIITLDKKKVRYLPLMSRIWREALVVFSIFFVTLSLFPGKAIPNMLQRQRQALTYLITRNDGFDWDRHSFTFSRLVCHFAHCMLTQSSFRWFSNSLNFFLHCLQFNFQIFDFIGRALPKFIILFNARWLWVPTFARYDFNFYLIEKPGTRIITRVCVESHSSLCLYSV